MFEQNRQNFNVWKYQDADRLRITDIDNKIFEGNMGDVNDAEDEAPDCGLKEDSITIYVDHHPVTFGQSEIKSIEVI